MKIDPFVEAFKRVKGTVPEDMATFIEQEEQSSFDTQIGGDHYKKLRIQPLDFIIANELNFVEGNVVKYVTRWHLKGGVEDLKKARHYLDMLIEIYERNNK